MRNEFLLVLLAVAPPATAQSKVDPSVHKSCLEAKDYLGCVKAMTGDVFSSTPSLRIIEGQRELTGNSCPEQYAYSGSGYCTRVLCTWEMGGHAEGLGGKNWACKGGILQKQSLRWGRDVVKATYDPNCPKSLPSIGWQSSYKERGVKLNRNQYTLPLPENWDYAN